MRDAEVVGVAVHRKPHLAQHRLQRAEAVAVGKEPDAGTARAQGGEGIAADTAVRDLDHGLGRHALLHGDLDALRRTGDPRLVKGDDESLGRSRDCEAAACIAIGHHAAVVVTGHRQSRKHECAVIRCHGRSSMWAGHLDARPAHRLAAGADDRAADGMGLPQGDVDGQLGHQRGAVVDHEGEERIGGGRGGEVHGVDSVRQRDVAAAEVAVVAGGRAERRLQVVDRGRAGIAQDDAQRGALAWLGVAVAIGIVQHLDGVDHRQCTGVDRQGDGYDVVPQPLAVIDEDRGLVGAEREHRRVVDRKRGVVGAAGGQRRNRQVLAVGGGIGIVEEQPVAAEAADGLRQIEVAAGLDPAVEVGIGTHALEEGALDHIKTGLRAQRPEQGRRASDVRGGHRGAAGPAIGAISGCQGAAGQIFRIATLARHRAEDIDSRGRKVDAFGTIGGEGGQAVVMIRGRHRDDIVEHAAVGGRIDGVVVEILSHVAGGADDQVVRGHGALDHLVEHARLGRPAPTVVADVRAVDNGVLEALGQIGAGGEATPVVDKPHGHDPHAPVDAADAQAVVADGADRAGHVRAVSVHIGHVVVPVGHIPAVDVVNVAVAVVVNPVGGLVAALFVDASLAWVDPDVGLEILVIDHHAGIADGHDDGVSARRAVPGAFGTDVGTLGAAGLAHVAQPPQLIQEGIRGERIAREAHARLHVCHGFRLRQGGRAAQFRERPGLRTRQHGRHQRVVEDGLEAVPLQVGLALGHGYAVPEADLQPVAEEDFLIQGRPVGRQVGRQRQRGRLAGGQQAAYRAGVADMEIHQGRIGLEVADGQRLGGRCPLVDLQNQRIRERLDTPGGDEEVDILVAVDHGDRHRIGLPVAIGQRYYKDRVLPGPQSAQEVGAGSRVGCSRCDHLAAGVARLDADGRQLVRSVAIAEGHGTMHVEPRINIKTDVEGPGQYRRVGRRGRYPEALVAARGGGGVHLDLEGRCERTGCAGRNGGRLPDAAGDHRHAVGTLEDGIDEQAGHIHGRDQRIIIEANRHLQPLAGINGAVAVAVGGVADGEAVQTQAGHLVGRAIIGHHYVVGQRLRLGIKVRLSGGRHADTGGRHQRRIGRRYRPYPVGFIGIQAVDRVHAVGSRDGTAQDRAVKRLGRDHRPHHGRDIAGRGERQGVDALDQAGHRVVDAVGDREAEAEGRAEGVGAVNQELGIGCRHLGCPGHGEGHVRLAHRARGKHPPGELVAIQGHRAIVRRDEADRGLEPEGRRVGVGIAEADVDVGALARLQIAVIIAQMDIFLRDILHPEAVVFEHQRLLDGQGNGDVDHGVVGGDGLDMDRGRVFAGREPGGEDRELVRLFGTGSQHMGQWRAVGDGKPAGGGLVVVAELDRVAQVGGGRRQVAHDKGGTIRGFALHDRHVNGVGHRLDQRQAHQEADAVGWRQHLLRLADGADGGGQLVDRIGIGDGEGERAVRAGHLREIVVGLRGRDGGLGDAVERHGIEHVPRDGAGAADGEGVAVLIDRAVGAGERLEHRDDRAGTRQGRDLHHVGLRFRHLPRRQRAVGQDGGRTAGQRHPSRLATAGLQDEGSLADRDIRRAIIEGAEPQVEGLAGLGAVVGVAAGCGIVDLQRGQGETLGREVAEGDAVNVPARRVAGPGAPGIGDKAEADL